MPAGSIPGRAAAALLARMMAEPSQHRGKRQGSRTVAMASSSLPALDVADHHRDVHPQRTKPVTGREAIAHVIAEQQFQRRARASWTSSVSLSTTMPGSRQRPAGRHELAIDLHQANQAGVQRAALLQIAERGNVDAELARRLKHGLARRDLDRVAVDGDR